MHKDSCKFLYKKIRGGPVIGIASFCLYGSKALAISYSHRARIVKPKFLGGKGLLIQNLGNIWGTKVVKQRHKRPDGIKR